MKIEIGSQCGHPGCQDEAETVIENDDDPNQAHEQYCHAHFTMAVLDWLFEGTTALRLSHIEIEDTEANDN